MTTSNRGRAISGTVKYSTNLGATSSNYFKAKLNHSGLSAGVSKINLQGNQNKSISNFSKQVKGGPIKPVMRTEHNSNTRTSVEAPIQDHEENQNSTPTIKQ